MQIPIVIEPIAAGRFLARVGEPFVGHAEGSTADEAARSLEKLLTDRVQGGTRYAVINVPNGSSEPPIHFDLVPEGDWFFQAMREEIEKNRRGEDEVNA
jgi:hypothetical protein